MDDYNIYPEIISQADNYVLLYHALYSCNLLDCTQRSAIKLSCRLRIKFINTKLGHRSNALNFSIWLQDFMQ